MSQRQVSISYLFEKIGRQTIEIELLTREHESLIAEVQKLSKELDSKNTPSESSRGADTVLGIG